MPRSALRPYLDRPRGRRRLAFALATLALLTVGGTLGYVAIEDMSFPEAAYMAVITLSTVGFAEVHPLSDAGRWYTMGLIVAGIGTVFYSVGVLAEFLIEGRAKEILGRRAMERAIQELHDHVIICGFGRLGKAVAEKLERGRTPLVVIDPSPAAAEDCDRRSLLSISGSALDDVVLQHAGIGRARAIIAATSDDADNVFIALQAREANPNIHIHARAETPAGTRRLRLVGANQVVSPHQLGGQRIANAILRPAVLEFLELTAPGSGPEMDLEEVLVSPESRASGAPIRDLRARGIHVSIVAIKRGVEPIQLSPDAEDVIHAGDRVIAIGSREDLERLASLVQAE